MTLVRRLPGVIAAALLVVAASAQAATLEIVTPRLVGASAMRQGVCALRLSGTIGPGDAERAAETLADYASKAGALTEDAGKGASVCLEGLEGGDFAEAVALAELFSREGVATIAPAGETCAGPCAAVFLGGAQYATDPGGERYGVPHRILHPNAHLVLRAPTGETPADEDAALTALGALMPLERPSVAAAAPFRAPRVRLSLFEAMLSGGAEDGFEVSDLDHLGRWGIELEHTGPAPEPDDEGRLHLCMNALEWADEAEGWRFAARDRAAEMRVFKEWLEAGEMRKASWPAERHGRAVREVRFKHADDFSCTLFEDVGETLGWRAEVVLDYNTPGERSLGAFYGWYAQAIDTPVSAMAD